MRNTALALAALVMAFAGPAAAEDVAITFDDLPSLTYSTSLAYQQETTQKLLAGLKRQHIPATGFVNEIKLEGPEKAERSALLEAWLAAGFTLGNHSYAHLHFSTTPLEAYIGDVARGDTVTRTILARRHQPPPAWYRHPYLETGASLADRRVFEDWLGAHGYAVAPVSMENSDWQFALLYDQAVMAGDKAGAEKVRAAYVDFTRRIVPWYRQAALDVLGRRPAFVFLLHATRLNADSVDDLAAIFRADELKPVTLAQAMKDPAYATPDAYVGTDGIGWVARWALARGKPMPWASLPKPPDDIVAADAKLTSGAPAAATPPAPPH